MSTKVYGESATSKTIVYERYKRFREDRNKNVEDDERPRTRQFINNTRKRGKSERNGYEHVRRIGAVTDDHVGHINWLVSRNCSGRFWVRNAVAAKFVRKLSNREQKRRRMEVARESTKRSQQRRGITETRAYGYETVARSSQWKALWIAQKARQMRWNVKDTVFVYENKFVRPVSDLGNVGFAYNGFSLPERNTVMIRTCLK